MPKSTEQQTTDSFEANMERMEGAFCDAQVIISEVTEVDPAIEQALNGIMTTMRRKFYGALEESRVGNDLQWFEGDWANAKVCEGSSPEVDGAIETLRRALLVHRHFICKIGVNPRKIDLANQDIVSCMHQVVRKADEVQLGGATDGDYGHALLALLESVAEQILQPNTRGDAAVQQMLAVLQRHSTDEALR